jgi:type IV pilus assembly protein PilC
MKFAYKAVTLDGQARRGVIEASDRRAAMIALREQGMYVTDLSERERWRRWARPAPDSVWAMEIHLGRRVKPGEFAILVRQLATLLRAGVAIVDALNVLSQQAENKVLARALADISARIQSGSQLSQAAAEHPDVFPPVFVNMVRAGEVSGQLEDILDRLASFHEKEHYTREKVKSALTYPAIVGVLAVAVTVFLLVRVIPTFVSLFAQFHTQLPLPTRIVIGVSNTLVHQWFIWLGLLIAVIVGYQLAVRRPEGRYWRDWVLLRVPVFGELNRKSVIARMSRTLGTLFASGVPILQGLRLTADVVNNAVVAEVLRRCSDSLTEGQSLSEPFARNPVFPPLVSHMLRVGEETGQLDHMLAKIADFYEAETEAMADRLKALLEPMMVLFLSVIVGVIVTSVILPMFSLYQSMTTMG